MATIVICRCTNSACERADDPGRQEFIARPCSERALAGDENAEPKVRPSRKEILTPARSAEKKAADRLENAQKQIANLKKKLQNEQRAESWGGKGPSGGGRKDRKGGGCDGRRKGPPSMPKELIGLQPMSKNGEPICYGYNLPGGCVGAKRGKKCPKGLHVCTKRGCKMQHSYVGNH